MKRETNFVNFLSHQLYMQICTPSSKCSCTCVLMNILNRTFSLKDKLGKSVLHTEKYTGIIEQAKPPVKDKFYSKYYEHNAILHSRPTPGQIIYFYTHQRASRDCI